MGRPGVFRNLFIFDKKGGFMKWRNGPVVFGGEAWWRRILRFVARVLTVLLLTATWSVVIFVVFTGIQLIFLSIHRCGYDDWHFKLGIIASAGGAGVTLALNTLSACTSSSYFLPQNLFWMLE